MADQWYYVHQGQRLGPVSMEVLTQLLSAGQLSGFDLVWTQTMPEWVQIANVPELAPYAGGVATMAPGGAIPLGYGGYAAYGQIVYAGFWLRFCAAFIDALITGIGGGIVGGFVGAIAGGTGSGPGSANWAGVSAAIQILGLVVAWLYSALMESSASQATLGKMAMGLRATDMEGNRISFARATGRHFAKLLSMIILFIGYMLAGWTEKKQALHDMLAGTLVVRKPKY